MNTNRAPVTKPYQLTLFAIIFLVFRFETIQAQSISPLGLGMGVTGSVYALTYDSTRHLLYVGGAFSYIDGVLCNNIAVWDGKTWSALGKGINGFVLAIKVIGDTIYVGGGFDSAGDVAARCIAMWDGAIWHPLGTGAGTDDYVASIESFQGNIYISGVFTRVDTVNANYIAVWKKDHWESVGKGADQFVNGLYAVHDTLWAGGYFTRMDTVSTKDFAFYDGQKWNGTHFGGSPDWLITETKNDGKFYAILLDTIMHFEKDHWVVDYISGYSVIQAGSYKNKIAFIKMLPIVGDSVADTIEQLNYDTTASVIGIIHVGEYGEPMCMTQADSLLYVGGVFARFDDQKYTSLAAFNGFSWTAPGRVGIKSAISYGAVNTVFRDSANQNVYFGGSFDFAGGVYSPGIALFNEGSSQWSALGAGFNSPVKKIVQYKGSIYAAGGFTKSGAQPLNYIAKWNGTSWVQVGNGANSPITDMIVYDGDLYIGGNFTLVDTVKAKYVAKFDGNTWHLADGADIGSAINCFGIFNSQLLAGTNENGVKVLDNHKWSSMSTEIDNVQSLAVVGPDLYCSSRIERNIDVFKYDYGSVWSGIDFPSSGNYYEPQSILIGMHNSLYCLSSSDGFWQYKNNVWKFVNYINPYAAVSKNDSEYYFAGYLPYVYLNVSDEIELNDVGIVKFVPPHVTLENVGSICSHSSVFFRPQSNELNPVYQWHFDGGFPDTSSQIAPIVKYDSPGKYSPSCVVSNDVGTETFHLSDSIDVQNCADTGTDKYDYTWIMGYHYFYNGPLPALDFYHHKPDSTGIYASLDFFRTDACISDSDGNLLFFTNGVKMSDASGSVISNSSAFNHEGDVDDTYDYLEVPQAATIIPSLTSPDQYYIFHINGTDFKWDNNYYTQPFSLDYSIVNMNERTRKGTMSEVNQHIINDTLMYGTMQAVKHANGKGWWITIHKWNSNIFYLLWYSNAGLIDIKQDTVGPKYDYGFYIGESVFSPDGSQFAIIRADSNVADLYSFDRCMGEFYFRQTIHFNDSVAYVTSCSFSPDSRYLYISGLTTLYQFDSYATDVAASGTIIGTYDGFGDPIQTYFFGQQLAPDGKIYIGTYDGCEHLHVINNPDEAGLACNFVQHQVKLDGYNGETLPIFPNYRLGKLEGSVCDSIATVIFNPVLLMMSLYPNPANTSLSITFSKPIQSSATLRVYDETGQLVLSENLGSYIPSLIHINIDKLRPGIYILNITDRDKAYSKSFVKD